VRVGGGGTKKRRWNVRAGEVNQQMQRPTPRGPRRPASFLPRRSVHHIAATSSLCWDVGEVRMACRSSRTEFSVRRSTKPRLYPPAGRANLGEVLVLVFTVPGEEGKSPSMRRGPLQHYESRAPASGLRFFPDQSPYRADAFSFRHKSALLSEHATRLIATYMRRLGC